MGGGRGKNLGKISGWWVSGLDVTEVLSGGASHQKNVDIKIKVEIDSTQFYTIFMVINYLLDFNWSFTNFESLFPELQPFEI